MSRAILGEPNSQDMIDVMLYLQQYVAEANPFRILTGISGTWYNDTRSGEGFLLDVSLRDVGQWEMVATFYTYDGMGNQVWLIGNAMTEGDHVTVPVQMTGGGIFGPLFDPTSVVRSDWGTLEFSFSGLKTHTRNLWQANCEEPNARADIAAGFQQAVVDTMVIKCRRAMQQTRCGHLVIAGGVGANLKLRAALSQAGQKYGWGVSYPRIEFCTDNGAMIAFAGYHRLAAGQHEAEVIRARPRWPMSELEWGGTPPS